MSRIALDRVAVGRQRAVRVAQGPEANLAERRQEVRLLLRIARPPPPRAPGSRRARRVPLAAQHRLEEGEHRRLVARKRQRLAQELRRTGQIAELFVVEGGQPQGQLPLNLGVEASRRPAPRRRRRAASSSRRRP